MEEARAVVINLLGGVVAAWCCSRTCLFHLLFWAAGVSFSRILERRASPEVMEQARAAIINLLEVFGCMMLQHGLFQADPHAGNLLLQVCSLCCIYSRQTFRTRLDLTANEYDVNPHAT
jgi:hypothetical protein